MVLKSKYVICAQCGAKIKAYKAIYYGRDSYCRSCVAESRAKQKDREARAAIMPRNGGLYVYD